MRWLGPVVTAIALSACSATIEEPASIPNLPPLEAGVSHDLAQWRAAHVANIEYQLTLSIPGQVDQPISAELVARFDIDAIAGDVPLDFRESADKLDWLKVNGTDAPIRHDAEHLILPAALLRTGQNVVEIGFTAGDSSLNRNPDFLYTLFVPDRARTAFPVFDQPDLKARYRLTIEAPADWEVLAQAPTQSIETVGDRKRVAFALSEPVSSYLFSFVAGKFQRETRLVGGREMTMLYRETDQEKLARNMDAIFDLHGEALEWLEEYTGIAYPYEKFDFAAIPSYPYGGMEHPGAIQYREQSLFLDEEPSQNQLLGRASLIAHETAHMWFGDLVTMRWFNDVWTKEVFANFMAAKIVNPGFPDVDHELNFLLDHYPAAYSVDRTEGANPIRQSLDNLDQAGSLYGNIIYDKAPIMMRQLELVLGERAFRDGMREYLTTFAGGNATWPELIAILDKRTDVDLKAWSEVWVNTPGRPHYVRGELGGLHQIDPAGLGREWSQEFAFKAGIPEPGVEPHNGETLSGPILFNADGKGYGLFPVDPDLVARMWDGLTDLQKGAQLVNLYEQMLEGNSQVTPQSHYDFLFDVARDESNELLLAEMLDQMSALYWRLLSDDERKARADAIEGAMFALINAQNVPASTRKLVLGSLQGFAATAHSLERLRAIWSGDENLEGITLSERERTGLAATLAIKLPQQAEQILEAQAAQIDNPDERRRFAFLRPALSPDTAVRDAFFASLADEQNRATESWVLDALGYLHHPLRTDHSRGYVQRSLEWLEDIRRTGDIFFPAGWIGVTLHNHTDAEIAKTVRTFLAERPDYNPQLHMKILQAADPVYRAVRLRTN